MDIKILNLKARRELAGLNASELAKKVGVSPAAMHYIENGVTSPTLDTACAIADALGCTLDELLGRGTNAILPRKEDGHNGSNCPESI